MSQNRLRARLRGTTGVVAAMMLLAALPATAIADGAPPDEARGKGVSQAPGLAKQDTLRWVAPKDLYVGTAVAGGGHHEWQDYPDPFTYDEEYREVLAAEYSSLTPENQLKWEFVHPEQGEYNFGPADAIVEFAERNGQVVRGHTLFWHSQNPEWLEEGDFTPDELREILRDHIHTVVGRYAGRIHQWEVANEIIGDWGGQLRTNQNIWIRELGPEIIGDAFRWAHEADPDAVLFLNDYSVEGLNTKANAYYELVQDLLEDDVPIHGFGAQAHLGLQWGFDPGLEANLQRFADLGLETAITELDVRMNLVDGEQTEAQREAQALRYQQVLEACLAVEGCNSFTVWGTTDKYSWVPVFFSGQGAATIMTDDMERKPAYYSLQQTLAEARWPGVDRIERHPAHRR